MKERESKEQTDRMIRDIDKFPARRDSAERMGKLGGGGGADLGTGGWVIRCGGRSAESVELHVVKCGVIIMSIGYLNSAFFEEKQGYGGKHGGKKQEFKLAELKPRYLEIGWVGKLLLKWAFHNINNGKSKIAPFIFQSVHVCTV